MTNSASVTFRLPPELKARMDSLARRTRRSPSSFYCQMVEEGIDGLEDPRSRGNALVENLKGFWRYRVGDYRVICNINDESLLITAVKIGHRRDVYR